MKLQEFWNALNTVCTATHFESAEGTSCPRIVFAERKPNYFRADNKTMRRSWVVDVHFYTHVDFDPIVDRLEELFNEYEIPFDMEPVEFDRGAEGRESVIYYKFTCEV